MKTIEVVPVTLSYRHSGAAPGQGGITELAVTISASAIEARFSWDTGDPDDSLGTTKELRPDAGWRSVLDVIVREGWEALGTDGNNDPEYPWPSKMDVDGDNTLFTELLQLAWAGPPISGIVQALSAASDKQLLVLRESAGPLTSPRFLRQMMNIDERLDSEGSLRNVVAQMHPGGFDVSAIRRGARAYAAFTRSKAMTDELQKAWDIFGFEADIERVIASWRSQNPAGSANEAIGRGVEAKALKDHLLEFVGRRRALPSGSQILTATFGESSHQFQVDFDLLAKMAVGEDGH